TLEAIQPPPSKPQETELEPISKSESESEDESETKPKPIELDWDWESKSLEYLKDKYENDPLPRSFMCPRFPFDAIDFPQLANVRGHNYPQPIDITDDDDVRTRLTLLSKLALDKYNAKKKKGPKYDFDDLVKATSQHVPLGTYYITFNAKPKHAPSNRPATTFQAHVRHKISGGIVVKSCSIKN
ncbi:hypothetical protein A2U01_0020255, partial [Trifolium medium]|nr:hypothetical protein [Trifolium medium]